MNSTSIDMLIADIRKGELQGAALNEKLKDRLWDIMSTGVRIAVHRARSNVLYELKSRVTKILGSITDPDALCFFLGEVDKQLTNLIQSPELREVSEVYYAGLLPLLSKTELGKRPKAVLRANYIFIPVPEYIDIARNLQSLKTLQAELFSFGHITTKTFRRYADSDVPPHLAEAVMGYLEKQGYVTHKEKGLWELKDESFSKPSLKYRILASAIHRRLNVEKKPTVTVKDIRQLISTVKSAWNVSRGIKQIRDSLPWLRYARSPGGFTYYSVRNPPPGITPVDYLKPAS